MNPSHGIWITGCLIYKRLDWYPLKMKAEAGVRVTVHPQRMRERVWMVKCTNTNWDTLQEIMQFYWCYCWVSAVIKAIAGSLRHGTEALISFYRDGLVSAEHYFKDRHESRISFRCLTSCLLPKVRAYKPLHHVYGGLDNQKCCVAVSGGC